MNSGDSGLKLGSTRVVSKVWSKAHLPRRGVLLPQHYTRGRQRPIAALAFRGKERLGPMGPSLCCASQHVALQATARLSFVLFWPAYAAAALAALFGPRFQPLRRRVR